MKKPTHKILARMDQGQADVRILIQHPMETGNRKHPVLGVRVPRHFIQQFRCDLNDREVLSADWGWGVSRNPYLSFRVNGARPGDRIHASWLDNKGVADSVSTRIK